MLIGAKLFYMIYSLKLHNAKCGLIRKKLVSVFCSEKIIFVLGKDFVQVPTEF